MLSDNVVQLSRPRRAPSNRPENTPTPEASVFVATPARMETSTAMISASGASTDISASSRSPLRSDSVDGGAFGTYIQLSKLLDSKFYAIPGSISLP